MSLFPDHKNSLYFSMDDSDELLSRTSQHPFELDDARWLTVEHYYQANKFENGPYKTKVAKAESAEQARKLGRARFKRKRSDFASFKTTLMTRALYIKARTYPEVARRLLDTASQTLVENSQFDYYWGCGRDHRGDNNFGKILMNIRDKLKEDIETT